MSKFIFSKLVCKGVGNDSMVMNGREELAEVRGRERKSGPVKVRRACLWLHRNLNLTPATPICCGKKAKCG